MSRSLIVMVGLGMLGVGGSVCAAEKERVYKGKTARQWVAVLKDKSDRRSKEWVIGTLGEMGPDARVAVPALIELLKDKDLRVEAAAALGEIGPDAKAALPAMMEALRAERRAQSLGCYRVARSLALIGEAAVPLLLDALEKEQDIQEAVATALGYIGEPAAAPLVRLLAGKNTDLSHLAWITFGQMKCSAAAAVPLLLKALKDGNPEVRFKAAYALASTGQGVQGVVPGLLLALRDKHPKVRAAAAETLGLLGPEAITAVPALADRLRDELEIGCRASFALASLGEKGVPSLVAALRDRNRNVRVNACLGRWTPLFGQQSSVPSLHPVRPSWP
jgi:HEAT repeat protein